MVAILQFFIAIDRTMEDATDTIRYPRTLTATDTEWRRIRERADAAGIPISRFICQRAAGPELRQRAGVSPEAMLARLENIETAVLALAEVERQRLAERGEAEGWEATMRRVALRLRAERPDAGARGLVGCQHSVGENRAPPDLDHQVGETRVAVSDGISVPPLGLAQIRIQLQGAVPKAPLGIALLAEQPVVRRDEQDETGAVQVRLPRV